MRMTSQWGRRRTPSRWGLRSAHVMSEGFAVVNGFDPSSLAVSGMAVRDKTWRSSRPLGICRVRAGFGRSVLFVDWKEHFGSFCNFTFSRSWSARASTGRPKSVWPSMREHAGTERVEHRRCKCQRTTADREAGAARCAKAGVRAPPPSQDDDTGSQENFRMWKKSREIGCIGRGPHFENACFSVEAATRASGHRTKPACP